MSKNAQPKPQKPSTEEPKLEIDGREANEINIQELARREAIARAEREQAHIEAYLKAKGLRIQTVVQIFDNQIVPGWRVVLI